MARSGLFTFVGDRAFPGKRVSMMIGSLFPQAVGENDENRRHKVAIAFSSDAKRPPKLTNSATRGREIRATNFAIWPAPPVPAQTGLRNRYCVNHNDVMRTKMGIETASWASCTWSAATPAAGLLGLPSVIINLYLGQLLALDEAVDDAVRLLGTVGDRPSNHNLIFVQSRWFQSGLMSVRIADLFTPCNTSRWISAKSGQ